MHTKSKLFSDLAGIIPARYASTRFPGKPLVSIQGKPMIIRVCERASEVLSRVIVATDDARIEEVVSAGGYEVIMTRNDHSSGTSRCFEAFKILQGQSQGRFNSMINIQGDEPFVNPDDILAIARRLTEDQSRIDTLVHPVSSSDIIQNPNRVKVVINVKSEAMYFSRAPLPFARESGAGFPEPVLIHAGIYGFPAQLIPLIETLPPHPLELTESLEQLRWLANGIPVLCVRGSGLALGIDTPEDMEQLRSTQSLS